MKAWKLLLVMMLAMGLALMIGACGDDDGDDGITPTETISDKIVGTWLSAGDDVAPLLAGPPFNIDSIRVEFTEDLTITLEQHVTGGDWTTFTGTYVATESETGTIHSIAIEYTAFTQEGIVEITEGTTDEMKLEVVQTIPDYGFTVPTPEAGFGADPVYLELNIQMYVRID